MKSNANEDAEELERAKKHKAQEHMTEDQKKELGNLEQNINPLDQKYDERTKAIDELKSDLQNELYNALGVTPKALENPHAQVQQGTASKIK